MDKITVVLNRKQMEKVRQLAKETETDLPTALAGIVEFFDKERAGSEKDSRLVAMVEEIEAIVRRAGFQRHSSPTARRVIDGEGNIYESANKAAKTLGIHPSSLCMAARGERKRAGGRTWRYVDEK
jgi:hypothetical protein